MENRQKAIEWFRQRLTHGLLPGVRRMYTEAINAMEELEAMENHPTVHEEPAKDINVPTNGGTISRQAAIDALDRFSLGETNVVKLAFRMGDYLKRLPSAQPELIRCKDCKWWTKQKGSLQGRCALLGMYPTGEWYCANAKMEVEHETDNVAILHQS